MVRPPTWSTSPNGTTAKVTSTGTRLSTGARKWRTRSVPAGTTSSFRRNLIGSATSVFTSPSPAKPRMAARFAPIRSWMSALTFRSKNTPRPITCTTRRTMKSAFAAVMATSPTALLAGQALDQDERARDVQVLVVLLVVHLQAGSGPAGGQALDLLERELPVTRALAVADAEPRLERVQDVPGTARSARYSASAAAEKRGRPASVVTLAPDHVDLSEGGDDVRQHVAAQHLAERRHAVEGRRAHAHAVGAAAAVAHQVEAELAVAALGGDVDLAGRDLLPLDHQLEVVHQAFDRGVDLLLGGQEVARVADRDRALGEVGEGLLDDAHALLHLRHAHHEAVVVVAARPGGDREVDAVVDQVRLYLAHIVGNAGGTQQRARQAVGDRVRARELADADHAVVEDAVPGEEPVAVGEDAAHLLERCGGALLHVGREVLHHAAEAAVGDGEARAGHRLDQVVEELARLEHVEAGRDGAQLVRRHAEAGEVIRDAGDLTADHADVLAALGHRHARQLLDREREPDVVQDGRGVVQAVGVREAVVPRPLLAHLLEAAVEVADLHLHVDDGLAVEAEVELDGAVRRRVRRPHLDLHHVARSARRARHQAAPLRRGYQGCVMGSRSGTSGCRLSTG